MRGACQGVEDRWGVGGRGGTVNSEHKSLCSIKLVGKKLTEM